jgi:Ca2+-binding RTX toxin-like protein
MCALMSVFIMVGPSFGAPAVLAQASPSNTTASPTASPSPSSTTPAEPTIKLLNPSLEYDAEEESTAKVSDKFDGIDSRYHVVAYVANAPGSVIVELSVDAHPESTPDCEVRFCNDPAEETVGLMEPVTGAPGLYEFYWDVPDDFDEPDNVSDFTARLFSVSGTTDELADDSVLIDVDPDEEATELTWPTQNGVLGFYKGRGGAWRTVVDGSVSAANAQQVRILYTTSNLSGSKTWVNCATVNYARGTTATFRNYRLNCVLAGKDTPSQVTAIAAFAREDDNPSEVCPPAPGPCRQETIDPLLTTESADVHKVSPFVQTPSESTIALIPSPTAQQIAQGRSLADGECMTFLARVRDQYDRPVQGANVDIHAVGPTDTMGFGADTDANNPANNSSNDKAPDKGGHNSEPSWDCDFTSTDDRGPRSQGDTNVPAGPDIKHIESIQGSGVSGGGTTSFGEIRFHIRSQRAGFTDLTAWIDDEALPTESANRDLDDDIQELTEKFDTFQAQWYAVNPTIQFEPTGGSGVTGSCQKYVARVRSGSAPVPGINVDIHARGPNDDLDFCDPEDASPRRAPDLPATGDSAHQAEEADEASHTGASPKTQHTEGETDDAGNFVFGVTSPVSGDTTIIGWVDREPGFDNDVQDSGEPSTSATQTWGTSLADATIRFLNPSGYASGADLISNQHDADNLYHLVARTDAAEALPSVEFLLSANGTTFSPIGNGTRVGTTDTYEMYWDSNTVTDGDYTLRVQITGTDKVEDRAVTVMNDDTDPDPGPPPAPAGFGAETVEVTKPVNGAITPFVKSAITVAGVASEDTRAVKVYYTKTSANTVRGASSWVLCGRQDLPGATAQQNFSTSCTLNASDQASQVTGIAAIAVSCERNFGCPDDNPALGDEFNDSGDAHRVFGLEANPIISLEPAESEASKGECERFVLRVVDQTGQAISKQNVDIHLTGPTDTAKFCDPGDGSPRTNPNDGSHATSSEDTQTGVHQDVAAADTKHTEGTTATNGRFTFGVTSSDEGDSQLLVWIDQTENDVQDSGEPTDTAKMHWITEVGPHEDKCTIRGTQGDDVIEGTSDDDVICGMGGNDVINGMGGNDTIRAGFGKDTARGSGGDDTIRGRQGADKLSGGTGTDTIQGGRGTDRINGGPGQDGCVGGPGRDRVSRCE